MRRGRIFIYLALILLVALAAVFLIMKKNQPAEPTAEVPEAAPLVHVIVAGQNINQGETITMDKLDTETVALPPDKVASVMFRAEEIDQVLNQVAKYPIPQDVLITRPMLAGSASEILTAGPPVASKIPPGMTAIAVPITRLSSVAYGVMDGAHVNVIACFLFVDVDPSFQSALPDNIVTVSGAGFVEGKPPILTAGVGDTGGGEGGGTTAPQGRAEMDQSLQQPFYVVPSEQQRPRQVCQMIVQDVVVLHLGDFSQTSEGGQNAEEGEGAPPAEGGEETTCVKPDLVSLIVSPQDAITLTYLMYGNAKLNLTLRRTDDASLMNTEAATLQYVLSQYAIPVPAKLPYAMEPRVDQLREPFLPNDMMVAPQQ